MSSNSSWLSLRLQGPLQSWGYDSQYHRRRTGLMPTKSAIIGMCCAAAGANRGSDFEKQIIAEFALLHMTSLIIPRVLNGKEIGVRRLNDFHTVQNTIIANGDKNDNCVITNREYLTDANFGIILYGNKDFLQSLANWLEDPVWGIWLGRKCCIPSAPILVGLFDSETEALKPLIGDKSIESFTRQEDVDKFSNGKDSIPDQPISFDSSNRKFAQRRVNMIRRKGS